MPSKRKTECEHPTVPKKKLCQTTLVSTKSELKDGVQWEVSDSLLVRNCSDSKPSSQILGLDLDGTIITTASGKVFSKDINDWKLINDKVNRVLKDYNSRGFRLVIMSNQSGITHGYVDVSSFQKKVESIASKLDVPIQCYFAISSNQYRKPLTGMWDELEKTGNGGVPINKSSSFYCGDAAGRPAQGSRKKDHACSDRLFALNVGVPFLTPEQLWFGDTKPDNYSPPSFDPQVFVSSAQPSLPLLAEPKETELIVMVGYPGSGKSHFCQRVLEPLGYKVVSRDNLGTWQKCVKLCSNYLAKRSSVVVDNTNMDLESRARYVKVARDNGVPVRCFIMQTAVDHCKHNNRFRSLTDPTHSDVSQMAFNLLKSKYVAPTTEEGFVELVNIPFVFDQRIDNRSLYCKYLLEK